MCSLRYATCYLLLKHRCRYEFRIQWRQRIVIEPSEKIYSTIVQNEKKRLFKSTWWGINRVPKTKLLGGILFKWDKKYYCCLLINHLNQGFHISQKGIIFCRIWQQFSTLTMTTSVRRLAYVICTTVKINVWKTTKSVFRRSSLISSCWLWIWPWWGSEHSSLFLWKFATNIAETFP